MFLSRLRQCPALTLVAALILLVAACLFPSQTPLAAQSPAKPPQQSGSVIRTTTRLVTLDVVVTDKSGKPVKNLTAADFTILEDGNPQQISNFEPPEFHSSVSARSATGAPSGTPASARASQNPGIARTILVLDEMNTAFVDQSFAWQKMKSYLASQGPTLAQPTELMFLTDKKLFKIADYSQDSAVLLAGLKKHELNLPGQLMRGNGVQGAATRLIASLLAVDEIALSNASLRGRKNVIWIGSGVPQLSSVGVSLSDRDVLSSSVRSAVNWLQETQTTIYTVDPRGVEVSPEIVNEGLLGGSFLAGPGTQAPGELIFEALAPQTGGRILRGRNDIDVAVGEATADGASYYTLAYYPANNVFDGQFRKIRVKLSSPDLQARTQEGYLAIDEGFGASDKDIDYALSRAVKSPVAFRSVTFQVVGKNLGSQPPSARFIVSVDREALSWISQENGDERAELTLVTAEISKSDAVLRYKVRELEFLLSKEKFNDPANSLVKFSVNVELPLKTDHVRFVLRDAATGSMGTADCPRQNLETTTRSASGR